MSLRTYLTKQRYAYAQRLLGCSGYWWFSAVLRALYGHLNAVLPNYVRGRTLDAGAGALSAKAMLSMYASEYRSFDITDRTGKIDIVGDIQNMKEVPSDSFDTVFCLDVLEHVPRPSDAVNEIMRVLKDGGHAIIIVPLFNGLHEEPYDFFRYTPYGLRYIVEGARLHVIEEHSIGGLISFFSHPISYILVLAVWGMPLLRWVAWALNIACVVLPSLFFDDLFRLKKTFPVKVLIVARKEKTKILKNH